MVSRRSIIGRSHAKPQSRKRSEEANERVKQSTEPIKITFKISYANSLLRVCVRSDCLLSRQGCDLGGSGRYPRSPESERRKLAEPDGETRQLSVAGPFLCVHPRKAAKIRDGLGARYLVTGVCDFSSRGPCNSLSIYSGAVGYLPASVMGKVAAARAVEPLGLLPLFPRFLRNDWSHAFKLLT